MLEGCRWSWNLLTLLVEAIGLLPWCSCSVCWVWLVRVDEPQCYFPLWLGCWLKTVDKSRRSASADVRDAWAVCDECLEVVLVHVVDSGDVSAVWAAWPSAAEGALSTAYLRDTSASGEAVARVWVRAGQDSSVGLFRGLHFFSCVI